MYVATNEEFISRSYVPMHGLLGRLLSIQAHEVVPIGLHTFMSALVFCLKLDLIGL
jgi:hypothetical protein